LSGPVATGFPPRAGGVAGRHSADPKSLLYSPLKPCFPKKTKTRRPSVKGRVFPAVPPLIYRLLLADIGACRSALPFIGQKRSRAMFPLGFAPLFSCRGSLWPSLSGTLPFLAYAFIIQVFRRLSTLKNIAFVLAGPVAFPCLWAAGSGGAAQFLHENGRTVILSLFIYILWLICYTRNQSYGGFSSTFCIFEHVFICSVTSLLHIVATATIFCS